MTNRELDALVAEKIFRFEVKDGWIFQKLRISCPEGNPGCLVLHRGEKLKRPYRYSTNISATWQVVEEMRIIGWYIYIDNMPPYTVMFGHQGQPMQTRPMSDESNVCRAICLAALKAMGVDVERDIENDSYMQVR